MKQVGQSKKSLLKQQTSSSKAQVLHLRPSSKQKYPHSVPGPLGMASRQTFLTEENSLAARTFGAFCSYLAPYHIISAEMLWRSSGSINPGAVCSPPCSSLAQPAAIRASSLAVLRNTQEHLL